MQDKNILSATESERGPRGSDLRSRLYKIRQAVRWNPVSTRGSRVGLGDVGAMQGSYGGRHVSAPNSLGAGASLHAAVPALPHLGQQLHGDARNPPMSPRNYPVFANSVFVPDPHIQMADITNRDKPDLPENVPEEVGGHQPRHPYAGVPPDAIELLRVVADQQGRDITRLMWDVKRNLDELYQNFVLVQAACRSREEPVMEGDVIRPYVAQFLYRAEGREHVVDEFRAKLSEIYTRFVERQSDSLQEFRGTMFELHARFLFLLDVCMNKRSQAH